MLGEFGGRGRYQRSIRARVQSVRASGTVRLLRLCPCSCRCCPRYTAEPLRFSSRSPTAFSSTVAKFPDQRHRPGQVTRKRERGRQGLGGSVARCTDLWPTDRSSNEVRWGSGATLRNTWTIPREFEPRVTFPLFPACISRWLLRNR